MRFARLASAAFVRLDGSRVRRLDRPPWEAGCTETGETDAFRVEDLACPVAPTKIVCVGRNYAAHAKELGNDLPAEPLLFFKPPSSLLGPGGVVRLPSESSKVEHEAELGVVIGHRAKGVAPENASSIVFGYTCVCDVTARDLQRKDGQWTRAKGFDTFCPAGPWIETNVDNPGNLRISCRVNGAVRQESTTARMLFDVPALIAYVSRIMTLEPGDLLVTGTPEGVGPLVSRDEVEVDIASVGVLSVRIG